MVKKITIPPNPLKVSTSGLLGKHLKEEIKFFYIPWQEMECCHIIINDIVYLSGSLNNFKLFLSHFNFLKSVFTLSLGL